MASRTMAAAPPPVGGGPGRRAAIRPWRTGRPLLMGSDEGTTPGLEVGLARGGQSTRQYPMYYTLFKYET